MTSPAVILAAHGSHAEPSVNAQVLAWAADLRHRLGASAVVHEQGFEFWSVGDPRSSASAVIAAFHQGAPRFAEVLEGLDAESAVVVPVMTSEGYFAREFLPAELARNGRHAVVRLHQTSSVGTHPGIVDLLHDRVAALAGLLHLSTNTIVVALIGHGTPRHQASRVATESAASALRDRRCCADVVTAYIDDEPPIESVLEAARDGHLIVIPFLIGAGPHAVRDVPRRLGLDFPPDSAGLFQHRCDEHLLFCDAPIGVHPGIIGILEDLARRGLQELAATPFGEVNAGGAAVPADMAAHSASEVALGEGAFLNGP